MTGWTRHKPKRPCGAREGAALITALFVVAVLFAIVLTATILSRQEVRIAFNVADTIRAKLAAEGGANIAIAALNADLGTSRAITSISRIMHTYYGTDAQLVYDSVIYGREKDIPPYRWLPVYGEFEDVEDYPGPDIIYGPTEMSDVVGRFVFAVVDEAGKININVAGNPGVREYPTIGATQMGQYLPHRANEGVTPAELDLRVLPGIGEVLGARLAHFRSGAPEGEPLGGTPPAGQVIPVIDDTAFPGKANVDDDMDTLFISSDGIDNDGDGLVDEALFLPDNRLVEHYSLRASIAALTAAWTTYSLYRPLEGVDEPDEFRLFNPVLDNTFGEEYGDRAYKTVDQAILIDGIGIDTLNNIRNLVTVDSFDRAVIYRSQFGGAPKEDLKLNLNLDDAETIARTLMLTRPGLFNPLVPPLRQKAFQNAANIADFRDSDCARTEMIDPGMYDGDPAAGSVYGGVEAIRINEIMPRPVWRVEAETSFFLPPDPLGFWVTFEALNDGNSNRWLIDPSGGLGSGSYLVDPWPLDFNDNGDIEPDERHMLTIRINPSALVPTAPYYLILDLTNGDGEPGADVEYIVEPYWGLGWQTARPADSAVPGLVAIDLNATNRIDPILAPPLVIHLRKHDPDDDRPACVNAVILSQEPDAEWVELVNVGRRPVRLDNWELEITGAGIGTIPPNTVIDPGGYLVLTVDRDDLLPLGADPNTSIFGNGLSLVGWPPLPGYAQLVFRNNVIDGDEAMILGGGMFPNNPREDGIDSDGDGPIDDGSVMVPRQDTIVPSIGEMQVVTLYEGPAQWGRVVDRVTYSSSDVRDPNGDWRPDVAGEDFYLSLERMNPYSAGDRSRNRVTNELQWNGYRDGSYDWWEPSAGSRLGRNVALAAQCAARGEPTVSELDRPRVKNASFSTVGELVDVPFYDPDPSKTDDWFADPTVTRPTTISILDPNDLGAILELVTTSGLDLTWLAAQRIEGDWKDADPDLNPNLWWLGAGTEQSGSLATWVWDADDGVEDGVYNLYVFIGELEAGHPDMRPVTIEALTDPVDVNGDGQIAPDEWAVSFGPRSGLTARPDGVISYGTIEVRRNGLAVRIVNEAQEGVRNTFTRIALAPGRRDYGKLNVNTASSLVLSALPGGAAVAAEIVSLRDDDGDGYWDEDPAPGLDDDLDGLIDEDPIDGGDNDGDGWVDEDDPDDDRDGRLDEDGPYRSIGALLESMYGRPEYAGDPAEKRAALERFKRISNLITVRSDVFEIICLGQAGRLIDSNGDGILTFPDDQFVPNDQFVPIAEKKIRVVYER